MNGYEAYLVLCEAANGVYTVKLFGRTYSLHACVNNSYKPVNSIQNGTKIMADFASKVGLFIDRNTKNILRDARAIVRSYTNEADMPAMYTLADLKLQPSVMTIEIDHDTKKPVAVTIGGASSVIDDEHGFSIAFSYPRYGYLGVGEELDDWAYLLTNKK